MKKMLTCLLLTLLMLCSLMPSALAANKAAEEAAETLYELGLFRGTGTNPDGTPIFDLDKTPSRNQAVIMLVRLLGKEQEALSGNWDLPFTDVPKGSTAYPYIGYAYANGLTNGTTKTTYSGTAPIRTNQYITFVLRAMGYESGKDFEVSTAWTLSDKLGFTHWQYNAANAANFLRADVAKISASALSAPLKDGETLLADRLVAEGVFTKAQYDDAAGKSAAPAPEKTEEKPFTETGFGDKWLHEYLLSLEPDSVGLHLTAFEGKNTFDTYRFENRFLYWEISAALKEHYSFVRIREADVTPASSYDPETMEPLTTLVTATNNSDGRNHITIDIKEADETCWHSAYYFY